MNKIENDILKVIKDKKDRISTKEIAEKIKLERHTLVKYLNVLKSKGLIECQTLGRTNLWHLAKSPVISIIKEETPIKEVLNAFDDGITILDKDNKVIWANDAIKSKGSHCYENYSEESCKDCPAIKTFKTGKKHRTINTYTKNGKKVSYELTTSPIKDQEQKTIAVMEISRKLRGK
ncbi:PAS domain-containing protein [Candidatus Woesearchaeota archaeon]|nr:PAS domain-containing protein [Candidatus Woesearchaeota archaeon]